MYQGGFNKVFLLEKKIVYSFICLFNLEETLAIFKGGLCMYMMTIETSNLCTPPHFIVVLTKIKVSFKLFCQNSHDSNGTYAIHKYVNPEHHEIYGGRGVVPRDLIFVRVHVFISQPFYRNHFVRIWLLLPSFKIPAH